MGRYKHIVAMTSGHTSATPSSAAHGHLDLETDAARAPLPHKKCQKMCRLIFAWIAVLLAGCAPLHMRFHLLHLAANGSPHINAQIFSGKEGAYVLHSGFHSAGPRQAVDAWEPLDIGPLPAGLRVPFAAPRRSAGELASWLTKEREQCMPTAVLISRNLALVEKRLADWLPSMAWPRVVFRLAPEGQGLYVQERSAAPSVPELTLYLGRPVERDDHCSVQAMLASEIAEIVMHELIHIAIGQRFGRTIDMVTNEYIASASQLCVRLEINGRLPYPMVLIPGYEFDRENIMADHAFWELVNGRKMPSTLAGLFIAESMRTQCFGPRPLDRNDVHDMNRMCSTLHRLPSLSVRTLPVKRICESTR